MEQRPQALGNMTGWLVCRSVTRIGLEPLPTISGSVPNSGHKATPKTDQVSLPREGERDSKEANR